MSWNEISIRKPSGSLPPSGSGKMYCTNPVTMNLVNGDNNYNHNLGATYLVVDVKVYRSNGRSLGINYDNVVDSDNHNINVVGNYNNTTVLLFFKEV